MFRLGCFICVLLKLAVGLLVGYAILYLVKRELRKKKEIKKTAVVAISGGCRGIGKELALTMARHHQCKIVIYDTEKNLANDLIKEIQNLGATGYFFECDFRNRNSILMALAHTLAELHRVDIYIHTGGFTLEKSLEDYCYEEMSLIMETNFLGPTILIKELLSIMQNQAGGHIVNVPSMTEVFNSTDIFTYCGAKGALGKMVEGLKAELKKKGSQIKVSSVRPLLVIDKVQEEVDIRRVRAYAEKIHDGIIYEQEEI